MKGEITYSTFQLIVESKKSEIAYIEPQKEHFENIPNCFSHFENGTYYKLKKYLNDDYFALSVEFGKPAPHRNTIVNVNTDEEDKNKRTYEEAELSKQSFFMYHFGSKRLYMSNSKQINLFSNILTQQNSQEIQFIIKRLFRNFEDFISILKSVEKIRFSGFKNLFSSESKEFKALADLTGTSSPECFTLEASYNPMNIKQFLQRLKEAHSENKIEELMICGVDENGFESIYNVETFSRQFKIRCNKNKEGIFDNKSMWENLLIKIEELCEKETL